MTSLKIVHCANFSYLKNGEVFYATDRKITFGLMSQGHFVYDFSYRDLAKFKRSFGFKSKSIKQMNQALIETCLNIQPDLLLLAKSEFIQAETLEKIKKLLPNIKIAKWFVDFLAREEIGFFNQFKYIDAFFQTSAAKLKDLSKEYPHMICSYIPNITDKAFDKKIIIAKKYDVIYVARDHKEDVRHQFAVKLNDFCLKNNIKLKLYASLGNPPIFGQNYYNEIASAKIAINFNRTDKLDSINTKKYMGSSDRMNHFMGTGTCTFSPRIPGLERLYSDKKDVVYFDSFKDCCEKINEYLVNDKFAEIAVNGNNKVYQVSNAAKVTGFILDTIFDYSEIDTCEWSDIKFKNGESYGKN